MLRHKANLEPINCLYCGITFKPNSPLQKFCPGKRCCYRYHANKKISAFPDYVCQYCGKSFKLSFNPTKESSRFENVKCPHCLQRRCVDEDEDE